MKHPITSPDLLYVAPLATVPSDHTRQPEPGEVPNPGGNGENEPIPPWEPEDLRSCWVYRVALVLHNNDGTIHDWAFVKLAPWVWGEPCLDDQLRDWAIQYWPDWLIMDARLATEGELSNFADEEF
jgi:hypothetical protein